MQNKQNNDFNDLFWADKLAKEIIERKKFHYVDKPIKKQDVFTVKTSASLSGVLHIGRLSDTIRGESVVRALKDHGKKVRFIWVAENMDPLRKVPKGVPADFEKYLGTPVTDIPDPDGCHESYAEHHMEEYFKVLSDFIVTDMEKLSMRKEYQKGTFKQYIKKIIDHAEEVREIQNRYRTNPLKKNWLPWTPICDNCGKIVTARVTDCKDGIVSYECQDYEFETTTAKGCGHKGENDPVKGNGKLMWKSEWATQWATWDVSSEGAGKEYQVPNSAWWINGEIVEKIYEKPMPVPIFYEHIMIDNQKMSASLGNVVYPRDWLEVAPAKLLRFFYNKRLMTTRSFSWKDLPVFYDSFDKLSKIASGVLKLENEKEAAHSKRLFELSNGLDKHEPLDVTFSHAAVIAQIFPNESDIIASLKKTGHYTKKDHKAIFERLSKAKLWLEKHAPEEMKFTVQDEVPKDLKLSPKQKKALHQVADLLSKKDYDEKSLFAEFRNVISDNGLKPQEFFQAAYYVLLNKERGPKLAHFIVALGKEKVVSLFEKV